MRAINCYFFHVTVILLAVYRHFFTENTLATNLAVKPLSNWQNVLAELMDI